MKYAFRWRERAVVQLRAIPQPAALTILQALTPLGDDPCRSDANVRKLAGYEDRYRLRAGDYGVCTRCGQPIGVDRLAARPAALTCIRCAARG